MHETAFFLLQLKSLRLCSFLSQTKRRTPNRETETMPRKKKSDNVDAIKSEMNKEFDAIKNDSVENVQSEKVENMNAENTGDVVALETVENASEQNVETVSPETVATVETVSEQIDEIVASDSDESKSAFTDAACEGESEGYDVELGADSEQIDAEGDEGDEGDFDEGEGDESESQNDEPSEPSEPSANDPIAQYNAARDEFTRAKKALAQAAAEYRANMRAGKTPASPRSSAKTMPAEGTHTRLLLELMLRPGGASGKDMTEATGIRKSYPAIGRRLEALGYVFNVTRDERGVRYTLTPKTPAQSGDSVDKPDATPDAPTA